MPESVPAGYDSLGPAQGRRGRGRVDYAVAGAAGRAVIFAANGAELTPRQHRVLAAVVSFTALYSRIEERVYLAHLAAFAHGVSQAEPWQVEKTRKALAALEDLGLVARSAPRGRPPGGSDGPAYWIALRQIGHAETQPAAGPDFSTETQPSAGLHSLPEKQPAPGRKSSPPPAEKAARPRPKKQPAPGGPTEKTYEEASEKPAEEKSSHARARAQGDAGSLGDRPPAVPTTVDDSDPENPLLEVMWELYFGDDWDDFGDSRCSDVLTISDHINRRFPDWLIDELKDEILEDPPEQPRLILRVARRLADENDIELPRLRFPAPSTNGRTAP